MLKLEEQKSQGEVMRKIKKICSLILITSLVIIQVIPVMATISDEQESLNELSSKAEEIQSSINEAEASKAEVEGEIESLDSRLTEVTTKLYNIQEDMTSTKKKIKKTKKKLKAKEADIEEQYDSMKIRIKYMYENGDTQLIALLFESQNMADFLNRAEYISEISQYDRKMLDKMQETKTAIEKSKVKLEEEYAALESLESEQLAQQGELDALVSEKQKQVEVYETQISDGEDNLAQVQLDIEAEKQIIAEMERLEAEAESRRLAEEASRQAAEAESRRLAALAATQGSDGESATTSSSEQTTTYNTSTGWVWPVAGHYSISSDYGYRTDPISGSGTVFHSGIDIPAPSGTAILAASSGEVAWSCYSSSAGNWIGIYHGNGVYSVYMHCSYSLVSTGDTVSAGQVIAGVGTTGSSTGNHLHFAVRVNGSYVNPHSYLGR
ncbi:MAG: murein hydrolase activator EnvC family protein [Eubacterium sp.]